MSDLKERLTSRKLWLAIAACVYTAVLYLGGSIDGATAVENIRTVVIGYIAAEGLADSLGRLKPSVPVDPAPTLPKPTTDTPTPVV